MATRIKNPTGVVQTGVAGAGAGSSTVATPCDAYVYHQNMLYLEKALMKGTEGMREVASVYLPQEDGEDDLKYQARIQRSVLFNMFKRTVVKLVGEVFSKPVVMNEDVDEEIASYEADIDLNGKDLNSFCMDLFKAGLTDGVVHILVDYPPTTAKTVADAKAAGARPYFIMVPAANLIGWRFNNVPGKKALSQIRIQETIEVPYLNYDTTTIERIRVIEPNNFKVFEMGIGQSEYTLAVDEVTGLPNEGIMALGEIPLVTIMFGEPIDMMTAHSPLNDLAELNAVHFQSTSDQRNILHYSRMAVWFGKCLDVDETSGKVVFGANRLIHSNNPQSDLKTVEIAGSSIEAGRNDLKDLEQQMGLFGLALMMPGKTGGVTATERAIESSENDSSLQTWASLMGSRLNQALGYMARWLKKTVEAAGTVKVNTDYKTALRSFDADVLIKAFVANIIPHEMVEELKRRGIITQDVDFIDLLEQMDADAKRSPAMNDLTGIPKIPVQFGPDGKPVQQVGPDKGVGE